MTIEITDPKLKARVIEALEDADHQFWAVIASAFPEASTGDIHPELLHVYRRTTKATVEHWVAVNVPKQATTEQVFMTLKTLVKVDGSQGHHITHEYPGFIDVCVSDELTLGFSDDDGFAMHVKDERGEAVAVIPLGFSASELAQPTYIAHRLLTVTGFHNGGGIKR